jgi:hypothetical protein
MPNDAANTPTSRYLIVGILNHYRDAESTVQDLELAGIVGEQVEVISDIDDDARTANTPGEPATKLHEPHRNWFARLFGESSAAEKPEVRDLSGEQPDYIGEQEFYANHIKQGGAIVIVRTTAEQLANRAAAILHDHGARTPGEKGGPAIRRVN